jgi:hypothetical protein
MRKWLDESIEKLVEKGVLRREEPAVKSLRAEVFQAAELGEGEPLTAEELTFLRAGVNTLSYCAGAVRWDLCAPLGICACGQSPEKGRKSHLTALRHLWSYVKGTVERELAWSIRERAGIPDNVLLECEVDSNFGKEKARSGLLLRWVLDGEYVTFAGRSWKQSTISLSTAEAEITGLSGGARELLGCRNVAQEVLARTFKCQLAGDNAASVQVGSCQAPVRALRHLTLQQLFVRELTADGVIELIQRPGAEMGADALTKVLGEQKLSTLLPYLSMRM